MTTILAVLGTFIVTGAGNVLLAHYYLRLGWQLGRDDRVLDPGETTGRLSVGESSGRHAAIEWPDDAEQTQTIPAVSAGGYAVGGFVPGVRPEARA